MRLINTELEFKQHFRAGVMDVKMRVSGHAHPGLRDGAATGVGASVYRYAMAAWRRVPLYAPAGAADGEK